MPGDAGRVELDADDPDGQTLLLHYPSVTADGEGYVRRAVKIESGAKSALDPNSAREIVPYVAAEVPALDLRVRGVTTIDAERTFWDKVVILHGLRTWYYRKNALRQEGERISRHYYDVFRLLQSPAGRAAAVDLELGAECVRHARMFFNRPDYGLEWAAPGTFTLVPDGGMYDALEGDYLRMSEMIFGEAPPFLDVVRAVGELEVRLNDESAEVTAA